MRGAGLVPAIDLAGGPSALIAVTELDTAGSRWIDVAEGNLTTSLCDG